MAGRIWKNLPQKTVVPTDKTLKGKGIVGTVFVRSERVGVSLK